jgi:hypothetical protein
MKSHTRSVHCAGAIETSIRRSSYHQSVIEDAPEAEVQALYTPLEDLLNIHASAFPILASAVMTALVVAVYTSRVH